MLEQAKEEYHSLQEKRTNQDMMLQDKPLLEKDKIQDQFDSLLAQVPAAPDIPEAIAALEAMAIKSGVELMGINYKKSAEAGSAEKIPQEYAFAFEDIKVQVRGDYKKIKKFIGEIEKESPRIYILGSSLFQVPIQNTEYWNGETLEETSSKLENYSNITAAISIKIIYDDINMPGVGGSN
ncbi:hypothetical protein ASZ90_017529 [hydrocarbon metagenome]|uniref:Uncharacterized protein n=1 Tax=hydrocarbon metagenome TaxID=938273 RepID=A0A0W8E8U7_9ZZZZ